MRIRIILLLLSGFVLTACPESVNKKQKSIEKSDLNLKNPKYIDRLGIRFGLPELFEETNYYNYTIKNLDRVMYSIEDLSIQFSIEKFSPDEIESIKYRNDSESSSNLIALRDHYIYSRSNSLDYSITSEPIELFTRTKKNGWMQSITTNSMDEYNSNIHFQFGFFEFKGNYYVFQLISGKQSMPYLLDDFLEIIKSVK